MNDALPFPPYPAETQAKGWRFEVDYSQLDQSDTWDLAPPEAKPWLLMMWLAAWKQSPCGSLPADEEVLPAKFGMPPELWARFRRVMLRGWWQASDGRLYHDTLTARVIEMLERRRKEADRKAASRAKQALDDRKNPPPVQPLSRGTSAGLHPESDTDHGVLNTDNALTPTQDALRAHADPRPAPPHEDPPPGPKPAALLPTAAGLLPTAAGLLCRRLKALGIGTVAPGNLRLTALLEAGATPEEFVALAPKALKAASQDPFLYLLGAVEGERKRAKLTAQQVHHGPMPPPPQSAYGERRQRQLSVADHLTGTGAPAPQAPTTVLETIDVEARQISS